MHSKISGSKCILLPSYKLTPFLLLFSVTGGLKFDTSVQTPLVKAGDHQTLTLESLTKKMYMNAAEGININANAHDIKATSLQDMTLKSQNGQVNLTLESYFSSLNCSFIRLSW